MIGVTVSGFNSCNFVLLSYTVLFLNLCTNIRKVNVIVFLTSIGFVDSYILVF